jgi:[ribosomal protein S5]-alanine N-acetyltransferase
MALLRTTAPVQLTGRRLTLRPLEATDFDSWNEVRTRAAGWLRKWEPSIPAGHADPSSDRRAFASRCAARDRERQLGTGYGFGMFFDGALAGEINLSSIQRGPFQSCYVGYWVDERHAGKGLTPEAVVVVLRFAFEELGLHRVQVAIIPRNAPSRRVMSKLGIREEGVATRYLEINGVWEDHVRHAITAEEWTERGSELLDAWVR